MQSLLHVTVTSNHHQADISVHGQDMFIAYSMGYSVHWNICLMIVSCNWNT